MRQLLCLSRRQPALHGEGSAPHTHVIIRTRFWSELFCAARVPDSKDGEMAEWLKAHAWKAILASRTE